MLEYGKIIRNFSYGIGYDIIKKEPFSYYQVKQCMHEESYHDYLHIEWEFVPKDTYSDKYEATLYVFYHQRDAYLFLIDNTSKRDIDLLIEKICIMDLTQDTDHIMNQLLFGCI